MISLRRSVFEESAPLGARIVSLSLLDQLSAAAGRLSAGTDTEALHDFRVSVRRLRTWIRELDRTLGGGTRRRAKKRLRKLMRATSPGRDDEVFLQWLAGLEDRAEGAGLVAAGRISAHAMARREDAEAPIEHVLREVFDPLRTELEEKLSTWRVTVDLRAVPPEPSFGSVLAGLLRDRGRAFVELVEAVEAMDAEDEAHRARIAGKRVRYLIEPVAPHLESGPPFVGRLKELQDALGDLHDAHLWLRRIRSAAEGWGEGMEGSGMHRLQELGREHAEDAFGRFLQCRDGPDRESFLDQIEITARELDAKSAHNVESERRYLLRGIPALPPAHESAVIRQGYLPGERLVERVRAIEKAGGEVRHLRAVKLGTGISRIEVEEAIDPALYSSLWSLTAGRRLSKRRHTVPDGGLVWEIDEFLDRELVLAEVELDSEDAEVSLPGWLAPVVEREVTGEVAYLNRTLAR